MIEDIDVSELAHAIWQKNYNIKLIKPAEKPKLYIMSGLPLSGKTYLANRIIERSPASVVYIENDLVRGMIMKELKKGEPQYTPEEHELVFATSHELIWLALSFSFHTIFDATNLMEVHRSVIYDIVDSVDADMLIVKTVIDRDTAAKRSDKRMAGTALGHSSADISIYDKMLAEDEPLDDIDRPYVILDTASTNVDELIDEHDLLLR